MSNMLIALHHLLLPALALLIRSHLQFSGCYSPLVSTLQYALATGSSYCTLITSDSRFLFCTQIYVHYVPCSFPTRLHAPDRCPVNFLGRWTYSTVILVPSLLTVPVRISFDFEFESRVSKVTRQDSLTHVSTNVLWKASAREDQRR